ncbi:mitochondrial uncoupling protein 5-like protein [Tanacetum coccineum]
MGLYEIFREKWTDRTTGEFSLARKISAGLLAGGIGAAVGNPADVAMVRDAGGTELPMAERRNYKGVGDAIKSMAKSEGVTSLWRGSSLTVNRAMIVTASQLASYDQIKETIIKNDLMMLTVTEGVEPPYKGAIDCAVKTVRAEGPMALYKGFIPTISRQGPFTVVLFVTLEQVRKLLKDF